MGWGGGRGEGGARGRKLKGRVRGPEMAELEPKIQSFRAGKSHNTLERKQFLAVERLSNEPYKCTMENIPVGVKPSILHTC